MPGTGKKAAILLGCLLWSASLLAEKISADHGWFPVFNFTSKTYNAQEQNWAIAQDNRGLLYFANTSGVLEFDGVNWRLIRLAKDKVPRSLAFDPKGRIYVGSENELGYLAPDSIGNLVYISLRDHLPPSWSEFQTVWNVFVIREEVYFQTESAILVWNGSSFRAISAPGRIHETFLANDQVYARIENYGLFHLQEGSLINLDGGDFFAKKLVFGLIRADSSSLLIATEKEGLFLLPEKGDRKPLPFRTAADPYLKTNGIFNMTRLSNGLISVGTWGGGVVILNPDGEVFAVVDKTYGLQDQIVLNQYEDRNGNLWLALGSGISRLEAGSPLSLFSDKHGLQGIVQSITRYRETIYVATTVGLFFLDYIPWNNGTEYKQPVFKPVDNLQYEIWDLLAFKNGHSEMLLLITNNDVKLLRGNGPPKTIMQGVPYDIYQSRLDPARVYLGLEDGLASMYFNGSEWIQEGKIDGISETIASMTEDHLGNLWMGTLNQGIVKLYISALVDHKMVGTEITKYHTENGLPDGPIVLSQLAGRLMIGTSKGLFRYLPRSNRFVPDSTFGVELADGSHYIHRISEENNESVWITAVAENKREKYRSGIIRHLPGGEFRWIHQPLARISSGIQHTYFTDPQGITWLGGPAGLYRFDPNVKKDYDKPYPTLIRKVSLTGNQVIFGGAAGMAGGYPESGQPQGQEYTLPYASNSLAFDFSAQSGESEEYLLFSYLLEGYDKGWSEWSPQDQKEYTNLYEGKYTLRVRSKNIFGTEGTEALFSFTILSPWYRNAWAFLLYLILLAGFILLIVKVYTRSLRRIIQERTAEVVMQKDEIAAKNKEITDSIHYASRIQSAILPPDDYLRKILNEHFILYMPRDIVSGDFYWMHSEKGRLVTVTADCTGHGVPGAFMSMLGVAFLNEIVIRHPDKKADQILNELRAYVIRSLRQTGKEGENQDGMDLSICIFDFGQMKMQFSGANNPLLHIRNGEIMMYQADKMPIGIHLRKEIPFTLHELSIVKGDLFYTFSDGIVDQFGGSDGKKFLMKRFKELLLSLHKQEMQEQHRIISETLKQWMTGYSQVDDILLVGIKV